MTWLQSTRSKYVAVGLSSAVLGFLVAWPVAGSAQDKKDPAPTDPMGQPADPNKDLADQVKLLQAKVARLESAVAKIAPGGGMGGMPGMGGMGMGGMGGMKGGGMPGMSGMMGMDNMMMGNMPGMGGMQGGGRGGMGGMNMGGMSGGGMGMMDDVGMMGMGPMGGQKGMKMKMTAALPGFPGESHIYHIGATDFFLDHPEHITLTIDQKAKLGQIKQKAVTEKANARRKIDEAEQQIWEFTASDQPDAAKIEAKVREVEKLRGDQRMAFIWSVGEAAKVLTDGQRKSLLGLEPANPHPHVHPMTP